MTVLVPPPPLPPLPAPPHRPTSTEQREWKEQGRFAPFSAALLEAWVHIGELEHVYEQLKKREARHGGSDQAGGEH